MGCDSSKVAPLFALSSPNEATNPFLDLPADVHRLISDFTASRTLSYTCRRTWCVLQHRHLSVQANGPWGLDKLLAVAPQTHSLTVISGQMAPVAPGVFPGLRLSTLPLLADVRLHFAENRLDLGHLSALAALGDAAGLTTVSIDLRSNAVGHRGAQALACISRAPRLTAVALNLQDNVLGDAGVRALAAFRDAPALRALELNAQNNRVGDDGVEGLAAIAAAPLRTLNLDLSSNAFADRGLTALAALGRTTSLTDLSLNLGCNMYLTDYCVDRLCTALFASNSLRDLYLGFGGTDLDLQDSNGSLFKFGPVKFKKFHLDLECAAIVGLHQVYFIPFLNFHTVRCLTSLTLKLRNAFPAAQSRNDYIINLVPLTRLHALTSVVLDLGQNSLSIDPVQTVADFIHVPTLRKMRVWLDRCNLGCRSMRPLGFLAHWNCTINDMWLDLKCNMLHDDDMHTLAALGQTPNLTSLRLDLSPQMGSITTSGIKALGLLRQSSTLKFLHLGLDNRTRCGQPEPAHPSELAALARLFRAPCALPPVSLDAAPHSAADLMAGLRDAHTLTALSVGIIAKSCGDSDAKALAKLRKLRGLRTLTLHMSQKGLGPRGAKALATLAKAPALATLTLDLEGNGLGDAGACALAALGGSRTLTSLTLHLNHNGIGPAGLRALGALLDNPALTDLRLFPRPGRPCDSASPAATTSGFTQILPVPQGAG